MTPLGFPRKPRAQTPISPKPDIEVLVNPDIPKFSSVTPEAKTNYNAPKRNKQLSTPTVELNIRFFFAKEKNWGIDNVMTLADSDFNPDDVKKYGKNILWLVGRQYHQPKCPVSSTSDNEHPASFEDVRKAYSSALELIVSFQFVIGQKFIPPVFTLGSLRDDETNPSFCDDPRNKEFKFVIVDREETRSLVADLLLLFHIKSDICEEGISLIGGEILQRAGKGQYRPFKFMLVKFIYRSRNNSPSIEDFMISMISSYLDKSMLKYCMMSKENREKYVDWLTNY